MALAIYAGTFDPVTFGHLDIVKRAAVVFDELIVATTANSNKAGLFSLEERLALLNETIARLNGDDGRHVANVRVQGFNGLLVDYARQAGAQVLVRGLRAASDFDYEFEMAMMNRQLAASVETVFFCNQPAVYVCVVDADP